MDNGLARHSAGGCTVFITVFLTVLAYGFNTGWMPFATTSDNYLSVVSSFLVFVELSFVQAIRAGMMSENNWNPTLVGLVLFLLNVLWSLGLGFDMWWNLFGDSVKARVCGMVAGETDGADDGAEERGVETVEEAKTLLAHRDATIDEHVATIADMGCRYGA